jgi:hypothetical protein
VGCGQEADGEEVTEGNCRRREVTSEGKVDGKVMVDVGRGPKEGELKRGGESRGEMGWGKRTRPVMKSMVAFAF